jgi:hypothetical protein
MEKFGIKRNFNVLLLVFPLKKKVIQIFSYFSIFFSSSILFSSLLPFPTLFSY